jgi:hypothetical protein
VGYPFRPIWTSQSASCDRRSDASTVAATLRLQLYSAQVVVWGVDGAHRPKQGLGRSGCMFYAGSQHVSTCSLLYACRNSFLWCLLQHAPAATSGSRCVTAVLCSCDLWPSARSFRSTLSSKTLGNAFEEVFDAALCVHSSRALAMMLPVCNTTT